MGKDRLGQKWDLKARVARLFCSDLMSDVIFMVDDPPERFPCHKVILGMGSHVFETMLFGKMPEKSPIYAPDVTAAGFGIMLQYLYSDSIVLQNESDAFEAAYVAKKYMIDNLFKACENYLLNNVILNSQTVFSIHEEASFLEMTKLQGLCLRYVSRNAKRIFGSKSFLGASKSTLEDILRLNYMVIDTECELMQAVWLWGEEQCKGHGTTVSIENVRKHTNDLMKYIRFASVATEDLEKVLEKFRFVDTSEALYHLSKPKDKDVSNLQNEVSSLSETRSIGNCCRLEVPTKYKYDGNMSTFTNDEHCQKITVSVSGPDVTILGFNIAFKPIPCYSASDRCLKIEFLINNYSTNAQTSTKSSMAAKEDSADQVEQVAILDDFVVVSEGDTCEIIAIVSGEGVRIMHCGEENFAKNCGSSRLLFKLDVLDDALLLPVKEILCRQT